MEIYQGIISAISSLGFPIVCVIYMWKYINTTQKELTLAINKLCDKIDDIGKETKGEHDENI